MQDYNWQMQDNNLKIITKYGLIQLNQKLKKIIYKLLMKYVHNVLNIFKKQVNKNNFQIKFGF